MRFNKDKLSSEELTFLRMLQKKAPLNNGDKDDFLPFHPAAIAELECLRRQADTMEERELVSIAEKYEIIGKKAEEFVPTLKSLKAAGGDAYDQMIAVLDASVAAVEKSDREPGHRQGVRAAPRPRTRL